MSRVRCAVFVSAFVLSVTLLVGTAFAVDASTVQSRMVLSKLWVGGDSMAYQISPTLCSECRSLGVLSTRSQCLSSTGLVRVDYYNWPAHLPLALSPYRPRAVVFMIGTNDAQPIVVRGNVYAFGTLAWKRVYSARVSYMMRTMLAYGAKRVYWIGMPIMRSYTFGRKMALLNTIFKAQAAAHPGVVYVDAWRLFSSSTGAYVAGWRSSDGIHFNMTGVHRLCTSVERLLERDF